MSNMCVKFLLLGVCCVAVLAVVAAEPVAPKLQNGTRTWLVDVLSDETPEEVSSTDGEVVTATGDSASGQCSIIFDFDGVIKIYQDQFDNDKSVAAQASDVFSQVKASGLKMGVATMSCEVDFIKRYLVRNFGDGNFPGDFLNSEKTQFCEPKKSVQMAKIIHNLGGDMGCAILYDDSIGNKPDVINAGHVYQFVDRYVGVTTAEYEAGLTELRARGNCNC